MDRICYSPSLDPFENLALEETLLAQAEEGTCLFLWRNRPTVVLGRNQNPYLECRPQQLEADGVCLVRRLSGGGAVYHDLGNLNYTFLCPETDFDPDAQTHLLCRALNGLGLECTFSGRNDLLCGGKKCSGQAYYTENGHSLHHGTLLVSVDLAAMERALTPSPLKLESKSIPSLRQRVVNLSHVCPGLTVGTVARAVLRQFQAEHAQLEVEKLSTADLSPACLARYRSPEWNLGSCPAYEAALDLSTPGGVLRVSARVQQGLITAAALSADTLLPLDLAAAQRALEGIPFTPSAVEARLYPFFNHN